jgi:nucleoside-diphosphate-sugar epimerase
LQAQLYQKERSKEIKKEIRMASERFLVTGAYGCLGSWAVKQLVSEGVPVLTYDLPGSRHRLHLIMSDDELANVTMIAGDITDFDLFERTVADNGITHIVHLAALQVPFVRANPVLGVRVNTVGTTVVLETARRHPDQVQGVAHASSAGVYGLASSYPPGPLANDAPLDPQTLYGVTKQANEGTARIYWLENGVYSVGLRPYIVYGPGRDQGMTSTPTKAMLAAAVGRPYHISFGGTSVYHHAQDAAAVFIKAARTRLEGAPTYNLGGSTVTMREIVDMIEEVVPEIEGKITFPNDGLSGPTAIDESALNAALGPITWRPMAQGVRQTIEHLRAAAQTGKVDVDRILA